jgi:hypothetical protein
MRHGQSLVALASVAVVLAVIPLAAFAVDTDLDGIDDATDTCTQTPNPSQTDTDLDGIGNACDADFNNDCFVDSLDFSLFQACFAGQFDPLCDLTEPPNGTVDAADFVVFNSLNGSAPGPSASVCPLLTFQQQMNVHTMAEAALSVMTQLADVNGSAINQPLVWSGTYDDNQWTYTAAGDLGGEALSLNYSGTLAGLDGQDITVSFTGTGMLGQEPLLMTGQTRFIWDPASSDYRHFEFEQLTKVGANSAWGWVVGAEVVAGVGFGVAVGVGVGTVIPPGGVALGVKTGIYATAILASVSKSAHDKITQGIAAPPKPPFPPFPTDLVGGESFPSEGNVITVVEDTGAIAGKDHSGEFRLGGTYAAGTFSGTIEDSSGSCVWNGSFCAGTCPNFGSVCHGACPGCCSCYAAIPVLPPAAKILLGFLLAGVGTLSLRRHARFRAAAAASILAVGVLGALIWDVDVEMRPIPCDVAKSDSIRMLE